MDTSMLKIFAKYQQTVLFEELEYEKYSEAVITNPVEQLVAYHIFNQDMEDNHPSQTDILYELRLTHSTLRKVLKKLIAIGYIVECQKDDARYKHYKPTPMVTEGIKIHTARHFKTLLNISAQLGDNQDILNFINDAVNKLLGSYANHKPYGDMDIEYVKSTLESIEVKTK